MSVEKELSESSVGGKLAFLAKDTVFYGLFASLAKLSAFISFPIYARFFSKEQFGIIDVIAVVEYLLVILVVFGQDSGLARYFYDVKSDKERAQLFTLSLISQIMFAAVVLLAFYFLMPSVMSLYELPDNALPVLAILLLKVPGAFLLVTTINATKWLYRRKPFVILTMGSVFLSVIASVVTITQIDNSLTAMFYAQSIVYGVFALLGIYYCRDLLCKVSLHPKFIEMLKFSAAFGVIYLFAALIPSLDRAFIAKFLGLEMLAIYAVAVRISSFFRLFIQAFQTAWGPFSMLIFEKDDAKKTMDTVLFIYCMVIGIAMIGITWLTPSLLLVLAGDAYAQSAEYVIYIVIGLALQSIGWITGIGSTLAKKSIYNLYSYFAQLAFTLIGMWLTVDKIGIWGVLLSVALGNLIQASLLTYLSNKAQSISLSLGRPSIVIACAIVLSLSVNFYNALQVSLWIELAFGAVIALVYLVFLWRFVINRVEREKVMAAVTKRFKPA